MKHITISATYLLTLFCLSIFVFDPAYLYYELPWLDIPMHVLGGFGVAMFTISILEYKKINISYKKIFFAYIFIAVLWESYEYSMDFLFMKNWNGVFDTVKDLIDGLIGMTIAYLFSKK